LTSSILGTIITVLNKETERSITMDMVSFAFTPWIVAAVILIAAIVLNTITDNNIREKIVDRMLKEYS